MTFVRFSASLSRGALLLCAVLLPLTFCPWTNETLEINKQTVLVVLVVVATIAALAAGLADRSFSVRRSGLFLVLGLSLVATVVSGILSLAPYTSFVGQAGQEYVSVITAVMFALYFALGAHVFGDTKIGRSLWSWLLLSSALVSLLAWPSFFGVSLFGLPLNLVGSPSAFAVYLIAMTTLGCGLWLTAQGEGKHDVLPSGAFGTAVRVSIGLTALTTLAMLLVLDYWVGWLLVLVGIGTLFAFAMVRAHEFPSAPRFVPPMLLFVFALMFLFVPSMVPNPFLSEVSPTQKASWVIATATLADGQLLFGSGPGTFVFDYTKFRAVEVNESSLWDVRFDRASSHVLTQLATTGVVGLLLSLAFAAALGLMALQRLVTERVPDAWKMTLAPFAAWLVLFVGQFLYASNMTIAFLFWLMNAVLASHVLRAAKEYPFTRSPRAGLAGAFAFVFSFVMLVTVLFVASSRYLAEVAFARAIALDRADAPLDDVITALDTAALRNRWSDVYYRNLGQALLMKTSEVVVDADTDPAYVQELVGATINASRRATLLSPANVVNWQLAGDTYRQVSSVIADASSFAVASYQEAIALAPNNPKYRVDLAQGYLVIADQAAVLMEGDDADAAGQAEELRTTMLDNALASLLAAQELKDDYARTSYFLASVYERQGKLSDAITSMEATKLQNPLDIGVSIQLALLYLKQGKNDLAKSELERALEISPNYSNARWYLATILEGEGDTDGAMAQLEAVASLNPDNETVANRLRRLREGVVVEPLPPPIEDDEPGTDVANNEESE